LAELYVPVITQVFLQVNDFYPAFSAFVYDNKTHLVSLCSFDKYINILGFLYACVLKNLL